MQTSIARDVIQSHKILLSVVPIDDSRLASSVMISTIYLHWRLVNSSSDQAGEFDSVGLCWEPIIDSKCDSMHGSSPYSFDLSEPPANITFLSEQTSHQQPVLFSQNKSAPAISHGACCEILSAHLWL
jgi:hypothetical protein